MPRDPALSHLNARGNVRQCLQRHVAQGDVMAVELIKERALVRHNVVVCFLGGKAGGPSEASKGGDR
jgi:hypothetical protein